MIKIAVIADSQMVYQMWLLEQRLAVGVTFTRVIKPADVLGRRFRGYIILNPDENIDLARGVLIDYLKASLFQTDMKPIHYTLSQRIRRAYANFRKV